jgi:hypothetical protein
MKEFKESLLSFLVFFLLLLGAGDGMSPVMSPVSREKPLVYFSR